MLIRPVALLSVLVLFSACRRIEADAVAAPAPATATPIATPAAASELPVLGPAPAWKAKALDGRLLGRDELKGKVVAVKFWATWCPPCVHEMPGYVRLQDKHRDKGLVLVGLSNDHDLDILTRFISQRGVNFPVAILDQETVGLFGETMVMMPTTYLIDREGRVRHRKVGAMDAEEYEKLILPLL
jgi:peroxiredoxin